MSDIIVYLDPVDGGGSACFVRAPFNIANPHRVSLLRLDDVGALHGPDVVRQIGRALADKLDQNATVQAVMQQVLNHPQAPPSMPIAFRVGDPVAHALSWEALVAGNDFLALDDRWPIARIARGGDLPEGADLTFAPPLRLVCVLSAVGRPAIAEWTGIHRAVRAARERGLPVDVTVLAGEEHEVIDVVRALDDPDVRVEPVPGNATDLLAAIEDHEPHLLHLFCHGTITDLVRRLEFGTIRDFDRFAETGAEESSVKVRVDELGAAAARAGAWAVVLNTCRGAEVTDEALTHAEEVVSRGVPVAIGFRRQVEAADAVTFSGAFYPAAFRALEQVLTGPSGRRGAVCWADTLIQARRKLRDVHGSDPSLDDAWTLPVLYSRPGPFEIVVASEATLPGVTHALGESKTVGGLVGALPEDAPSDFVDDLRGLVPVVEG